MPNLANAVKALRQNKKRAERNKVVRDELHSLRRHFRKLLEDKKFDEARKMMPTIYKKVDKSVTKGIEKRNAAARIKSRLEAAIVREEKNTTA